MPETPRSELLLALLREQRRLDAERGWFARASPRWTERSDRLDEVSDRIRYLTEYGVERHEIIGPGLQVDLDCRPEEDVAFRSSVLARVREAVTASAPSRLAAQTRDRLATSSERIGGALAAIDEAERALRDDYPEATLEATGTTAQPDTVILMADRDGRVA